MRINLDLATYYELSQIASEKVYLKLLQGVHAQNVARIREKPVIKVGFVMKVISQFAFCSTIEEFLKDSRFITELLVDDIDESKIAETRQKLRLSSELLVKLTANCEMAEYDLLFFPDPYGCRCWPYEAIPITALVFYTHYGLHDEFFSDKWVPINLYGKFIHSILFRRYIHTNYHLEVAQKYSHNGAYGLKMSGYPKMDYIFSQKLEYKGWKMRNPDALKIIFAPHWTIYTKRGVSNLRYNYEFMLNYAKAHPDTTSWVFKPHPALMWEAYGEGVLLKEQAIFPTKEDWQRYLDEWNNLPNARVELDTYMDIFQSSDCMIYDSQSFHMEYIYSQKPSLYLWRRCTESDIEWYKEYALSIGMEFDENLYIFDNGVYHHNLNDLSMAIIDCNYSCYGDDFQAITEFIEHTARHDTKASRRRGLFDEYFDYRKINGMLAGEYIYRDVCKVLFD